MATINIRNVDEAAAVKIAAAAKKQGLSREEYLRRWLNTLSIMDELKEKDRQHTTTLRNLTDTLSALQQSLNELPEEIIRRLKQNG